MPTSKSRWLRLADERGSAISDFIFVSVPLIAVALSTLALIEAGYLRNLMTDAAVEGARWAANADSSLAEGAEHARKVLQTSLGSTRGVQATAFEYSRDGVRFATVNLSAQLEPVGLMLLPLNLEVSADASFEIQ